MRQGAAPGGAGLLAVATVAVAVGCSPPPPTPTVTVNDVQVEIATNPDTGNPMGRRITGSLQLADPGTPAADPSPRIAALIWRGETASRRTCEHEFPEGVTPGESYEFEIICSAPGNDLSFVFRAGGERDRTYPCDGCERRPIL